jgi:hypothetical protein
MRSLRDSLIAFAVVCGLTGVPAVTIIIVMIGAGP